MTTVVIKPVSVDGEFVPVGDERQLELSNDVDHGTVRLVYVKSEDEAGESLVFNIDDLVNALEAIKVGP